MNNTIIINKLEDLHQIDEYVSAYGKTSTGENISFACNYLKEKNKLDIFDRSASMSAACADSSYIGYGAYIELDGKSDVEVLKEIKEVAGINIVFSDDCDIPMIIEKANILNLKDLNNLYQLLSK